MFATIALGVGRGLLRDSLAPYALEVTEPSFVPDLEAFLRQRLADRTEGSYSVQVMTNAQLAQRKIMEEAFEVCLELQAAQPDAAKAAEEAADLVFHLVCGLIGAGTSWAEVEAVLKERHSRPARHSTYSTQSSVAEDDQ